MRRGHRPFKLESQQWPGSPEENHEKPAHKSCHQMENRSQNF